MKTFIIGAAILLIYGGCCSGPSTSGETSSVDSLSVDSLKVDTVIVLHTDSAVIKPDTLK